ncbi:acyltransferase family protein [Gluconacetobacter asukensis]|uniref:Acyltransferase n=1 Tax=Gluconacetobacter asukensis TaxID=1017181 RepID=A0A7W4P244_9PROT|nr:acyltransferase [Gluconacetobacter asukensis]MBB2171360.1 acyltransferase [Gluconacetobacter asukensis]
MLQRITTPSEAGNWPEALRRVFFPIDRRRDVDGLRGLAVLLVVLFHAGWIRGGFIGVDVFIVISGYFMGRSALLQSPFRPVNFVCRRLYRLLPALLCMIVAVCAAMLWWVLASDRADIALNGAYSLVYLSNLWAAGHVGYFEGQSIAYPFLHTWSLSLEMQFYTIIFFMALFLPYVRHRGWAIIGIFVLSLVSSVTAHLHGDVQAYYSIFDRMWQFSLGTMIWLLPPFRISSVAANLVSAVACATIVLAGLFYSLNFACPSYMSVLPCLAAAALIALPQTWVSRTGLSLLSPLGVMSYSVYLWHWPCIVVANYLMVFSVHGWVMACVLALALVASFISYVCVERIGLAYEGRVAMPVRVRGALCLVGTSGLVALGLSIISAVSRVH